MGHDSRENSFQVLQQNQTQRGSAMNIMNECEWMLASGLQFAPMAVGFSVLEATNNQATARRQKEWQPAGANCPSDSWVVYNIIGIAQNQMYSKCFRRDQNKQAHRCALSQYKKTTWITLLHNIAWNTVKELSGNQEQNSLEHGPWCDSHQSKRSESGKHLPNVVTVMETFPNWMRRVQETPGNLLCSTLVRSDGVADSPTTTCAVPLLEN